MSAPALLRPATLEDVEGLLAFDMTAVVRTRADWIAAIEKAARGERVLLVAEVDGVIAAFAQAHHLERNPDDGAPAGWYLTGVTVLPDRRRRGLGRELTLARLDWLAGRCDEVRYFAHAGNTASIDLHHRLGFVEVSRAPSIHGVTFDGGEGLLFRRELVGRGIASASGGA